MDTLNSSFSTLEASSLGEAFDKSEKPKTAKEREHALQDLVQ